MKFRFAYEKLLEYRKQQEEIARRDYNESLVALDREKEKLERMYLYLDQATEEKYRLSSLATGVPIEMVNKIEIFQVGQNIRIKSQRLVIQGFQQIVEQKHEILISTAREFQVLEKLREKKLAEFKKIQRKLDAKAMDEIVVTRFKRGGDVA
jgi:flagellar export protein FliJ